MFFKILTFRVINSKIKKNIQKKGNFMADSIGSKEASLKWGVSQATISKWCREGKIKGAEQDAKGSPWRIPKDAERPSIK